MKKTLQKTKSLALRKETLRRLESLELKGAAGGARLRVPIGHADDTTPIYSSEDDTLG